MNFRTDINGLRALAIIAVVLFHFNPRWAPGGFAGVDVFFVLSGFLMTGIIFRRLEKNDLSIINFYVDRANRIIPALSVVCAVLLLFGFFFLTPLDYRVLGKHVASSMWFFSNMVYWGESGYFDTAPYNKWLLHTWSLSVEWQFYIIYPIVLSLLFKCISLVNLKRLFIVGTLLAFIISVYATSRWQNASYFLLPTRVWEMLMGGVAFLYPFNFRESNKKYLVWLGTILILASYFLISKDNLWPGYLALIPVIGTYFVIVANSNNIVTDNIFSQKIGLWSYSIYLWHWPVYVFMHTEGYSDKKICLVVGMLLSIALGYVSYRYIEKVKFRNSISAFQFLSYKPLYMLILIAFFGLVVFVNTNIFYKIPSDIYKQIIVDKNMDDNGAYTWLKIEELDKKESFVDNKYNVLVIGDSQAGDFINVLHESGVNKNIDIVARIVEARCGAFYLDGEDQVKLLKANQLSDNSSSLCRASIDRLMQDTVIKEADTIVVSMLWKEKNIPFIMMSISKLKSDNNNASIYVVGGKSFDKSIPVIIYEAYLESIPVNTHAFKNLPDYQTLQNEIFSENEDLLNFKYINMTNILCSNADCLVYDNGGGLLYYDTRHFTRYGAKFIGKKIKDENVFPSSFYLN